MDVQENSKQEKEIYEYFVAQRQELQFKLKHIVNLEEKILQNQNKNITSCESQHVVLLQEVNRLKIENA